ncbi:pentatricopeptide repeat-containing protein At1g52640, mitochondrial [Impatiens glandulifera]|uniref:pentatricopeptide repeat-containing protein At1g52640, mitochondrial n=1 Tax=Impatiens glandulifera TaxID=253017 RepID=UPI001FB13F95|nr:pentatricopeptide repeat-containing protein At1g52640, mitochondrial [Impatiens glandulifera]
MVMNFLSFLSKRTNNTHHRLFQFIHKTAIVSPHSLSNPFLSHRTHFCTQFPSPSPSPSSPHLVNELCRVLSDYRNPHNDLESALTPFASQITSDLVEQSLKRCSNLGFSAHRFFLWANRLPNFLHSKQSYHILVDVLGRSKQFPLMWDFLSEIKHNQSYQIEPELFWITFRAYSRVNLPADAIRGFNRMLDFGIIPNIDDLDKLLFALCRRKHVRHAQEFFDQIKLEITPTVKTYSILMRGWGDIGEADEAQKVFDEMLKRGCEMDLLAYNSMLQSLCKGGHVDEAYSLFRNMFNSKELKPDSFTYSIFIHAACDSNDIHLAFKLLDRMRRYDLLPNVYTYNHIIKTLCKNNKVEEAYQLFDEMIENNVKPDVWSYNTVLAYHCDYNEVNKAFMVISRMDKVSCSPDRHTYNMALKMLIRIGRFDRVDEVWDMMEKKGFFPSVSTYSVMVHGLCKKRGKLEEGCKYFEMMIDGGIPPYSTTCELLRKQLIGLGFAEKIDIIADKMERSTSCSIQELANVLRGVSLNLTSTSTHGDLYSD